MNTTKTVPVGTIESNGILTALKTLGLTVSGLFITTLIQGIYHFNFGGYEALAMVALPPILHFIVLFFSDYDIQVQDPSQAVTPAASQADVPTV